MRRFASCEPPLGAGDDRRKDGVLAVILATWNVFRPTVYNWLKEFVTSRWNCLMYEKAPGRPGRLTKTQKRQLSEWVKAGP
jgi:hypothetical protein